MTEQLANSLYNPTTTLDGAITDSATSLVVNDVSELPVTGDFRILIWDGTTDGSKEVVKVGAINTGTKTLSSLTREAENATTSPARAHADGALVELVMTAGGVTQYISENGGGGGVSIARSGDLFFEDFPANGDLLLFTTELAAPGTTLIRAWAVLDWDFDGDTWVNTGAETDVHLQLILEPATGIGDGVDLVTYDVVEGAPDGAGWITEFGPLLSSNPAKPFANAQRSAIIEAKPAAISLVAAGVFNEALEPLVTGRFEVFLLYAAP